MLCIFINFKYNVNNYKFMQEKVFELLFDKDEITWQSILYDLVRTEQMDPWDIDISLLTQKYLKMLKKLKEMDFRLSGKILLAAAILLKIKSNKLIGDVDKLQELMTSTGEEEFFEDLTEEELQEIEEAKLIPRTPQPRKRKVSIYDLVGALQQALEVKKRRVLRSIPTAEIEIPEKKKDITLVIKEIYEKIKSFFSAGKRLTFNQLIPSDSKEDKVYTFIPLLHLTHQEKVDLKQEEHFGEIEILDKS